MNESKCIEYNLENKVKTIKLLIDYKDLPSGIYDGIFVGNSCKIFCSTGWYVVDAENCEYMEKQK